MKKFTSISCATVAAMFGSQALAAGSPWLPAPEGGNFSIAYVKQEANKFYRGTSKVSTPGGGEDLSQETVWLTGNVGISDAAAFDFRLGRSESSFITGEGLPPSEAELSGFTDMNLGLTLRLVDEVVTPSAPSVALRAGLIIAGNYEVGLINSLGDGGDGYELSLLVGKFFTDRFALSGEAGYRHRDSNSHNIPESWFYRVSAGAILSRHVTLSLNYDVVDSQSGLDIGVPPFSPANFPEIEEDAKLLGTALNLIVSDSTSVTASYAKVLDGRNVADGEAFSLSLNHSF